MKVVCFDKIINLDKFESVQYRASLWGDSYPVEAVKHETSGGLFGGVSTIEEEIARFKHEAIAKALVKAITDSWLANEQSFDVEKWEREKAPTYAPAPQPNPQSENLQKLEKALLSFEKLQKQQEQQEKMFKELDKEKE